MVVESLDKLSPEYVAYKALGRLPRNAPVFETTAGGYPKVHMNERYCRAPDPDARMGICGQIFAKRQNLCDHLERRHGASKAYRPRQNKSTSRTDFEEAKDFYTDLMKFENYERLPESQIPTRCYDQGFTARSGDGQGGLAEEDDEDDEEAKYIDAIPGRDRAIKPANDEAEEMDETTKQRSPDIVTSFKKSESFASPSKAHMTKEDNQVENDDVTVKRESTRFSVDTEVDEATEETDSASQTEPMTENSAPPSERPDIDPDEEDLVLELEEAEARAELQRTELRKIELRRKLVAMRKRRGGPAAR